MNLQSGETLIFEKSLIHLSVKHAYKWCKYCQDNTATLKLHLKISVYSDILPTLCGYTYTHERSVDK